MNRCHHRFNISQLFRDIETMSISQGEKLRLIRESERLNRREVSDLTGINYGNYSGYESGKVKMPFEAGAKLFKVSRFRKYRDWFMFDEISPEAGHCPLPSCFIKIQFKIPHCICEGLLYSLFAGGSPTKTQHISRLSRACHMELLIMQLSPACYYFPH